MQNLFSFQYDNINDNHKSNSVQKRWAKYILAVISVIVMTVLIANVVKPQNNAQPDDKVLPIDKTPNTPNINAQVTNNMILATSDSSSDSSSESFEDKFQQELNDEMNKWFNPTNAEHDIDLTAMEFQFYENPTTGNLKDIISDVKNALPYGMLLLHSIFIYQYT